MRLIVLLIVVVIIGMLSARQLRTPQQSGSSSAISSAAQSQLPRVPQQPQGIKQFQKDINHFVDDAGKQRKAQIDEAAQ